MKARSCMLAAIALLGSTVPALAAETNVATLHYDDLNLATEAGQATLDQRIDRAARQVCSDIVMTGSRTGEHALRQRCESDARAQAKAQLTRRSD